MADAPPPPSNTRGRQPSPALSDSSELTMLSRSPSPPPGVRETTEDTPRPGRSQRGSDGRFLLENDKREASSTPVARPAKRLRVVPLDPPEFATRKASANARSPRTPQPSRTPRTSRTPRSTGGSVGLKSTVVVPEAKGAGDLDRLPKEIRQMIYSHCLAINEPILLKDCCGPTSTRRARASCKKHGDPCSKIGRGNGLTLYEEDEGSKKVHGRFSILSVARSIHEEASWVLHNHGRLVLCSTPALQAYLGEKQCTFFRLPTLPETESIERMWLSAGRFRQVCFELLWEKFSVDEPIECVYRLYEATALLMKAWDLVTAKPTSARTVDLQLNALHTAIIPFNSNRSTKMANEWIAYHQLSSGHDTDFEEVCEETAHNLELWSDLVGRHGGEAQWKVIAKAPRRYHAGGGQDDDDAAKDKAEGDDTAEDKDHGGLAALLALEAYCRSNGIQFVATI